LEIEKKSRATIVSTGQRRYVTVMGSSLRSFHAIFTLIRFAERAAPVKQMLARQLRARKCNKLVKGKNNEFSTYL
jgi:hypothetical protein